MENYKKLWSNNFIITLVPLINFFNTSKSSKTIIARNNDLTERLLNKAFKKPIIKIIITNPVSSLNINIKQPTRRPLFEIVLKSIFNKAKNVRKILISKQVDDEY